MLDKFLNKDEYFYNMDELCRLECDYNILLSGRSVGKSYSVCSNADGDTSPKYHKIDYKEEDAKLYGVLVNAYQFGRQFIYLRRHKEEIKKELVERFFKDKPVNDITLGEYDFIYCYANNLYFAKYDENKKLIKSDIIGYAVSLASSHHLKSGAYPDVDTIIFEEFITDSWYIRGTDEPSILQDFVSTVFRRRKGRVFLIGNKLSRRCPYYSEWSLTNVAKQPVGTIDVYNIKTDNGGEIKIAVENIRSKGDNSKMAFGEKGKSITGDAWTSSVHPKLPDGKEVVDYYKNGELFIDYENLKFRVYILQDENKLFLHVEPFTKEIHTSSRVISDKAKYIFYPYYSKKFTPLVPLEKEIYKLIEVGLMTFSDNLTGTEFKSLLKELY